MRRYLLGILLFLKLNNITNLVFYILKTGFFLYLEKLLASILKSLKPKRNKKGIIGVI